MAPPYCGLLLPFLSAAAMHVDAASSNLAASTAALWLLPPVLPLQGLLHLLPLLPVLPASMPSGEL